MKNVFTSNVFHNYLPRCKLGSKGTFFSLFYGETKTNGNQKNVFWNNLPRFETTGFLRKGFL